MIDLTRIDTVIFDLDQTLVDRQLTFVNFLHRQHERWADQLATVGVDEYVRFLLSLDNNGYADKATIYERVAREFNLVANSGVSLFADYTEFYGMEPVLYPHVHDLLKRCQARYKLGLISNGRTVGQTRKIEKTQIGCYFETILISETEGIKKPDVRIFERCLQRLSVPAERTVYIGDNPTNDIDAPKSLGMNAIWIDHGIYDPPAVVDATVHEVTEIEEILLR